MECEPDVMTALGEKADGRIDQEGHVVVDDVDDRYVAERSVGIGHRELGAAGPALVEEGEPAAHKLVQVVGAAGSGKSRLLQLFAQESSLDCQVLTVRCRDSDWAPFSALKRLLDGHLASIAQLHPEHRRSLEVALRSAAGPMAAAIGLLSPRLGELFREARVEMADGDVQRIFIEGLADFLTKYLESAAMSIVVIDDLHWLDASSRMVLSRVAARVCSLGHMFVCGARDDADSSELLLRFREAVAPELVETLKLGPLTRQDTSKVIADYLGLGVDTDPAPELVAQLAQLSDGTPLCLLELLRLMIAPVRLRS